jgi:hypothetical protein
MRYSRRRSLLTDPNLLTLSLRQGQEISLYGGNDNAIAKPPHIPRPYEDNL